MRVAVGGASGFLGSALVDALHHEGHDVLRLVRRTPQGPDEVEWHPETGTLRPASILDVDAVVVLNGTRVAPRRWGARYKATFRSSRIDPVATAAKALAAMPDPDRRTLLCGSAIGYYGDKGDAVVTESAPPGAGFMAETVVDWEAAAAPALAAGVRVVNLRNGPVLSPDSQMANRLQLITKLGVAGRLGTGRQYWSPVTRIDAVRAILFVLADGEINGPVNVVGPEPVPNGELIDKIARHLHRPAAVPAPTWGIRLSMGDFAHELLDSKRVVPQALTDAGFEFTHPTIDAAVDYAFIR